MKTRLTHITKQVALCALVTLSCVIYAKAQAPDASAEELQNTIQRLERFIELRKTKVVGIPISTFFDNPII